MAKKKTPDGEKCERSLPFRLNDVDKARKGEVCGQLNKTLEAAYEAKAIEMKKHNAKIKGLEDNISKHLSMINEGIERRPVTCSMVKNFDDNKIEFWFEGEILESRDMTPADRQLVLDAKAKKDGKKKEKWQTHAPKFVKGAPIESQDLEDEEIKQVHKLETSRKGASSMVDPK